MPISSARLGVKVLELARLSLSAYHRARANRIVVIAIACKLRNSFSVKNRAKKPIGIIGRLAISRLTAYRPSSGGLPNS